MDIPAIGQSPGLAQQTAGFADLGKDGFLRLLLTQLSHQDPLNPMDNEAMVAQLAQFSSLEQMQNLNATAETQSLLIQSLGQAMTTQMIGRSLLAASAELRLPESGSAELGIYTPHGAEEAVLAVKDASGRTVAVLERYGLPAGSSVWEWDGAGDDGQALPPGTYTLQVSAFDAEGQAVDATPLVRGVVSGVAFEGGQVWLVMNGQRIPLSSVLEFGTAGEE
ncbi:MAG: flagellar hook assembly protein FlgD [Candidatus Eisenbacteria bacterium]|nr:flagellar hook assembly protein FlgD [Candidatus Eisenbacteria bacterium]